jgi:radical SAM superfamily enzyme YgiQ (UPF0313 family)
MKRILLINPPYPFEEHPSPPFGLMSLAAYLIENGHEVRIEDYIIERCSVERYKSVLDEFNPDVIGATAVSMTVKKSLSILKDYRSIAPEIVTVMGGAHVTFDSEGILNAGGIDFIVRGEGEITFTELLNFISEGKDPAAVNGISYMSDGKVHHTPDRELIGDINILPYPARHLVAMSKYKAMDLPINMITSRGCPHSCIFCLGRRMVGSRLRYFDVERVVDEFEMLSKMGFSQINISDDLFTSNKKRCIAICDGIISRGIKQVWSAFARVDTISEELLDKLKEAGCTTLCFGIESGNQEILDRVKKKTTLDKCRAAADMCRKSGIIPLASYILGLPGETEETVKNTLKFAFDLNMDFGIHILAPFPGTEVREKAEEYGMSILTSDWDLYDANRSVCSTGGIEPEKIDRTVQGFYKSLETYMEEAALKKENGETISEKDNFMLRKKELYTFNMELIEKRIIENYPGSVNPENLLDNFSSFIQEKTGRDSDFVSSEIERLIQKQCIKIIEKGMKQRLGWV